MPETVVAFAGAGRASIETVIAFAGEKWVFLVHFSGAEVMPVSRLPCWGRAVVLLVSTSPRCCALCREKVRPAWPDVCVSTKKFALHAQNTPKSAFLRLLGELFRGRATGGAALGEFFRGNAAGGAVWGEFFRGPAVVGSRRASLLRRVPGSRALLLTVLTLQCAAKPYGWHGGQPARGTTHRVNVRVGGLTQPPVGPACH